MTNLSQKNANKKPLVYIVMPCYNGEKYLLEQLMSIYYQNYTNWYLIFVNDGSNDNSENILRDWISHYNLYEKVKVITKENGGVNSAVQRGLEEVKNMCDIKSTDSLISYCDCDDIRTREKLNMQVRYMTEHQECGLSFHDCSVINENDILTSINQSKNQYLENFSFFYVSILSIAPASNRIMFKAKYINDLLPMPINLPPKYQAQDEWTFLMLSLKNVHFHHIKKLLTYHRLGHYSASFQLSSVGAKDFRTNKKIIYQYLQERAPEKDLTYIINFKDDFFKRKQKYGVLLVSILVLLKYPKASFLCFKYVLFKIKAFLF